jgi:hypothetical protein
MLARVVFILLLFQGGFANAYEKYVHVEKKDIPKTKLLKNFGVNYALQWSFFYLQQHEAIKDHGSLRNMGNYLFSPHFDRDNLETNIIQHSMAGASYYLYYRSKGYSQAQAFLWTNLSSLAFEFTVETLTERPSYQDLILTPTLGTAVGFLGEKLSLYFHEKKVWPARILGFIFNPFSAMPGSSYDWRVVPVLQKDKYGASLEWRF